MGGCGIGVVIRNDRGQMMGSMSKRVELPLGALEIEAKAVEEGVQLVWDLGLKLIILKSDSLTVVNSLREHNLIPSNIHKVVEGTIRNLHCFDVWEASHTRRSSNFATHVLARHAKSITNCIIWVEVGVSMFDPTYEHDMNSTQVFAG